MLALAAALIAGLVRRIAARSFAQDAADGGSKDAKTEMDASRTQHGDVTFSVDSSISTQSATDEGEMEMTTSRDEVLAIIRQH